jgi:hypothetical protein
VSSSFFSSLLSGVIFPRIEGSGNQPFLGSAVLQQPLLTDPERPIIGGLDGMVKALSAIGHNLEGQRGILVLPFRLNLLGSPVEVIDKAVKGAFGFPVHGYRNILPGRG